MGIGIRMKELLRERGMTIKQFSELSGIPLNTLYSITKRDSERVDPVIFKQIAKSLNVTEAELAGINHIKLTPEMLRMSDEIKEMLADLEAQKNNSKDWAMLPDDLRQVAQSMERMNQEGREKVVGYADDLAQSGKYIKRWMAHIVPPPPTPAPPKGKDTTADSPPESPENAE